MKKWMFALLSAVVAVSMLTGAFAEQQVLIGSAAGMKDVIEVAVTMEDDAIVNVEVTSCHDTDMIKDAAIADVPARIVAQQNIEVDVTAGATVTSLGIRNAVRAALTDAGIDVEPFKRGSDAVKEKAQGEAESYDIVVVGGGISGLSAAIEVARNSGASVVVLEKEGYAGGSSLVCGGGIWAVDSSFNQEVNIDSTADELIAFLSARSEGKPLNEALIHNAYDAVAGDTFEYLANNGLPYSMDTVSLSHPDSQLPVFWSIHNTENPWETGESGYLPAVQNIAASNGVEVRVNNRVTAIQSENGVVTGVTVESKDSIYTINASKVILATGGFTRNKDMVEAYAPDFAKAFAFTGAGSTGDGITLTKSLDTEVIGEGMMGLMGVNMNYGYYGTHGNLVWCPNFIVNKEGSTFGMASAFYSETLQLLLDQTDSQGYGIFDTTTGFVDRLEGACAVNAAKKFDTLADLANVCGINADALAATASENGLSAEGPYYVMDIKPLFIGSIPGLKVDDSCRLLTKSGDVIENLYGCGELIFGNLFAVRYPGSGTGIGMSTYTGALAAKTAVTDMK